MRYILTSILLALSTQIMAETKMPQGCKAISNTAETLDLKAKKSSVFMIHNNSEYDLWLTHPVKDPGASAGWTSKLAAGHWSALVLHRDFALNCVESRPGHEQQIPCKDAIEVCTYKKIGFPKDNQGEYWAGENLSLDALEAHLAKRDFKLPADTE